MTKEQVIKRLEEVQDMIWDLEMGSLQPYHLRKQWEDLRAERNHLYTIIRKMETKGE